jgi:hypothetical protein
MKWYNKPIVLIGIFLALSALTGLATYGLTRKTDKTQAPPTSEGAAITDKTTGDKLEVNSGNRAPETYGKNPASPVLLGFDAMINLGITESDLATFQSGITQYFVSTTDYPPASKVALSNPTCHPPDDSGFVSCSYSLTVNDTSTVTGSLKTDLSGPVSVTLSKGTTQVFSTTVPSANS